MNVEAVARRVLAEFEEMPGLTLTVRQAARLFGLDQQTCRIVLDTLVDSAYLRETSAGAVTLGNRVAA
jgi:DNA-binding IclR family transcriptional regulator